MKIFSIGEEEKYYKQSPSISSLDPKEAAVWRCLAVHVPTLVAKDHGEGGHEPHVPAPPHPQVRVADRRRHQLHPHLHQGIYQLWRGHNMAGPSLLTSPCKLGRVVKSSLPGQDQEGRLAPLQPAMYCEPQYTTALCNRLCQETHPKKGLPKCQTILQYNVKLRCNSAPVDFFLFFLFHFQMYI